MKKLNIVGYFSILYLLFVISGYRTDSSLELFSFITVFLLGIMLLKSGITLPSIMIKDKCGRFLCIYLVLCYIALGVTHSSQLRYILSRLNILMPIVLYLYFEVEKKSIKPILKVIFVLWTFFSLRAIILYSTGTVDPREMASGMVEENVLTGGGYGFAIGSTILAVYLTEMILWKKIKRNILNISFIVILCAVVFYTQSTITIIALALGLFFAFIFRMFGIHNFKEIEARHITIILFITFIAVALIVAKEDMGKFILNQTRESDNIIAIRFKEIGEFLVHGKDSGVYSSSDMANRIGRIDSSFETFLKYPLLGAIFEKGSNFAVLQASGIGSHGELIDALGRYGIIIGIPYLAMFFYSVYRERKMQKNKLGYGYIIAFFILMYFNPFLFSQSTLILFFVVPMMTYIYNSDYEGDENIGVTDGTEVEK